MNTAEMPSGSEDEEEEVSDGEVPSHQRTGATMEESDDEENDAEDDDMVPEEVVDEEEEEEEEEEEPEPAPPPPPPPKVSQKSLQTYLQPKAATGDKKKKATVAPPPKPTTKAIKAKAAIESAAPSKEAARGGKTYSPHSDSDDEQEMDDDALSVNMTLPAKKQVPLPPDAIQEYEDQRAASTQAGPATAQGVVDAPPTVHASATETTIFLKNEKTNKWVTLSSDSLLYAPAASEAIKMQLDKLTIPGRKDRQARQNAMFDENATKMMSTVKIAKLQSDGSGSGTGPAMTNLLMLQSVDLSDAQTEIEFLTEKANEMKAGAGPGGTVKHVDVCTMLDPDIAKRIYAVHKCPLPQLYNPNTNSSNKYKVPSKLEETVKTDSNFTFLGAAERGKRAATKRASEAAPSKADGKRTANGTGPVPAKHSADDDEAEEVDCVHVHVEPCFTRIKWTAIPSMGVSMAGIKCAPGTDVRVVPAGEGSYILVKTPAGP